MPKMNASPFRNVLELGYGTALAGLRLEAGGRWRGDVVSGLALSPVQKLRAQQEAEQRVANHSMHISWKMGSRGPACAQAAA
jgi:hypothetical protein